MPCWEASISAEPEKRPHRASIPRKTPSQTKMPRKSHIFRIYRAAASFKQVQLKYAHKIQSEENHHQTADNIHCRLVFPQKAPHRSGHRSHCHKNRGKTSHKAQCAGQCLFRASLPACKIKIYTGSIGSRHGEINVMIPSRNAMIYCISSPPY